MNRVDLFRTTGLTDSRGRVFVVSGPSGVGKDTVLAALLSPDSSLTGVRRVVTATTRPPRPWEVDGSDYWFLSEHEFLTRRAAGWFLETVRFGDYWYGTPTTGIKEICDEGYDAILKIETQGARSVRRDIPEAVLIFIHPPSLDELIRRLKDRNSEAPEALAERIRQAPVEMERARMYDYVVVNDRVDTAVDALRAIILAERHRVVRIADNEGPATPEDGA